jgi:hypothetical protein
VVLIEIVWTEARQEREFRRLAEALGATFLQQPLTSGELLAALCRAERQVHDLLIGSPPPLVRWRRAHER